MEFPNVFKQTLHIVDDLLQTISDSIFFYCPLDSSGTESV